MLFETSEKYLFIILTQNSSLSSLLKTVMQTEVEFGDYIEDEVLGVASGFSRYFLMSCMVALPAS